MKQVLILRGPPGSGKSTFVNSFLKDYSVCSADQFFIHDGTYRFDPDFLGAAHKACYFKFKNYIKDNTPRIVVDNTNIRVGEFLKYVQLAQENGYEVQVVRIKTPTELCQSRNVHGVPAEKVQEMANRFEPTPESLKETVIENG